MLNIAHRGFRSKYPENTILAFEKAIEVGVDGIEFDVHLTKDGEAVIIHDEFIDRTSDGKGLVSDFTLEELEKFNFANLYRDIDREKIPTLEEYFKIVKNLDLVSNIELKNGILPYKGLEEEVYRLIKKYNLDDKVLISTFNHNSLMHMKKIAPHIKCGALVENIMYEPWKYLDELKVECYHPYAYQLDKKIVGELHDRGYEVNCWFYAYNFGFEQTIDTGVDGIITDFPDIIKSMLNKK